MTLFITALANLVLALRNLLRRLRRPPRFVTLAVSGALPEFEPRRAGFLRRRINPRPVPPSLEGLRARLDRVLLDGRPRGVVLRVEDLGAGWATLEELRSELARFRERGGGRIVAYMLDGSDRALFLASAADEVYAPPLLGFDAGGPRSRQNFLKDALSRFGLRAEVLAVSPYKSAGDNLSRRDFSDESREQVERLLAGRLERLVGAISKGRSLPSETVREVLLGRPMLTAREAAEAGFIDAVLYEDELAGRLDSGVTGISEWDAAKGTLKLPYRKRARKVVGLVEIKGAIVRGQGRRLPVPVPLLGGEQAGSEVVTGALRAAEKSRRVGAVLLHVDSPGGDAFASDMIWREVQRLRSKKPVVVLMGNAAASGGYYVSAPASRIFARAGTLTGSIGVVLTRPVAADLLDRLGVNPRTVGPGADNDLFDLRREPPEREISTLQGRLMETYGEFKDRVEEGRGIAVADLEPIAGGRVWTGDEALARGLVDEVGGFREALAAACSLAGIKGDGAHALAKVRAPGSRPSPGEPARDAAGYVEGLWGTLREFGVARVWAVVPFDLGEDL